MFGAILRLTRAISIPRHVRRYPLDVRTRRNPALKRAMLGA